MASDQRKWTGILDDEKGFLRYVLPIAGLHREPVFSYLQPEEARKRS
jgi:hypothetical protein